MSRRRSAVWTGYSRSVRDLVRLAQDHPEAVREAAVERPLLARVGQGREEIERLLEEERRALIRKNEGWPACP